eukprot:CAMPEP_0178404828 /NCGR_PEP_ID=MMETSP0689_2-20121128/18089_1 /TAXON_ID=160604 /ORGANISM="Amphidinium massartii, Strain CS-259" /LENGTH=268 /DNA_ID=CAMNT_0020025833 /DNA_START=80 /DNA_END=886 /DNA_ORIENTATION=-
MAAAGPSETIQLNDGTSIDIARVPDVDDSTWAEVTTYLQGNPEAAKNLQKFARNPDAMRGWLQTQAIAEHYSGKMSSDDEAIKAKFKGLESDPELAAIFEDVKKNGLEAALKHTSNEELMIKISQKMGGLPKELEPKFQKLQETPLTIHEAAKMGDLRSVQEYLEKKQPLDSQDGKGITPLGYAIGANRIAVVKLLLDNRANPFAVDATGNSGLHYAAGYGRKELLEYLLKLGVSVNQANSQGQTPLSVATQNRHTDVVQLLQSKGAQ